MSLRTLLDVPGFGKRSFSFEFDGRDMPDRPDDSGEAGLSGNSDEAATLGCLCGLTGCPSIQDTLKAPRT